MKKKDKKDKQEIVTVQLMREIRDKFSLEIMNMSFEEEKAYLKELLNKKRLKTA